MGIITRTFLINGNRRGLPKEVMFDSGAGRSVANENSIRDICRPVRLRTPITEHLLPTLQLFFSISGERIWTSHFCPFEIAIEREGSEPCILRGDMYISDKFQQTLIGAQDLQENNISLHFSNLGDLVEFTECDQLI